MSRVGSMLPGTAVGDPYAECLVGYKSLIERDIGDNTLLLILILYNFLRR